VITGVVSSRDSHPAGGVDPTGRFPPIILLSKERVEKIEKSKQFQEYIETRTRQASVTGAQVSKWVALKEECVG
jgi:hypothetical protein